MLSNDEKKADIGGWVTIDNNSGKRYTNATLKLIAGDNTVQNNIQPQPLMMASFAPESTMADSAPSFS